MKYPPATDFEAESAVGNNNPPYKSGFLSVCPAAGNIGIMSNINDSESIISDLDARETFAAIILLYLQKVYRD